MRAEMLHFLEEDPAVAVMAAQEETVWINPSLLPYQRAEPLMSIQDEEIADAQRRLQRFAPFLMRCFPETVPQGGRIESPLRRIPQMQKQLAAASDIRIPGTLYLKQDSHLAIAGSVKARGGIYEVLKHAEDLALAAGWLRETDDYSILDSEESRAFFRNYTVQVGSTGNLGLSIGIMSAALGFRVIVHMSADAKQWKKDLLRRHGVGVMEYEGAYSRAVEEGRRNSAAEPNSYFVDDEHSKNLFLGYAVAASRLREQLAEQEIPVDAGHPLIVYLPCGVGGAPGGITYGLKRIFGDAVTCFFVEPVNSPCMALGLATGLHENVCVQDFGISGLTHADGLAVGRPSGFVGKMVEHLVAGVFTVADRRLYDDLRTLNASEHIRVEPSACAAFQGPRMLMRHPSSRKFVKQYLGARIEKSTHIVWATGGSLVPAHVMDQYLTTYL